jgi:hypothetical protein
LQDK